MLVVAPQYWIPGRRTRSLQPETTVIELDSVSTSYSTCTPKPKKNFTKHQATVKKYNNKRLKPSTFNNNSEEGLLGTET